MRTLSGQARPSDSGAAVRRRKAVLSAILCSDVGRNRWGTILYCLRSTSEIMALMKLAVTSMNCGVAKSNSAGKRSVIPGRDTCQIVHGPFFVPSTFHERHVHSMTKRVLDDLVDYAHFASAAPPHWTDNVVLPTIKRYLLAADCCEPAIIPP